MDIAKKLELQPTLKKMIEVESRLLRNSIPVKTDPGVKVEVIESPIAVYSLSSYPDCNGAIIEILVDVMATGIDVGAPGVFKEYYRNLKLIDINLTVCKEGIIFTPNGEEFNLSKANAFAVLAEATVGINVEEDEHAA